jgi:L-fucose isomerase-like protein
MINPIKIAALPIGEFESDITRREVEAITGVFIELGAILTIAETVTTEDGARQTVQKLLEDGHDLLLFIPTRGLSAQIMETAGRMSHTPCLIWPTDGRFALPSSALAAGALREAGFPTELFYAPPDHPGSSEVLTPILKAAVAYSRLGRSRIGVIGGLFPNLVSCRYEPQIVESRLGLKLLTISFDEIRDAIQNLPFSILETEQKRREIITSYRVDTTDLNALDAGLRLHMALKQIVQEKRLDGFATECWSAFPKELGSNPCLGFVEDSYTLACEGDVMSCVSQLMVKYLTGSSAYTGDVYHLDMDGVLTLVHCGAPASLASDPGGVLLVKSGQAMERGFETINCRPQLSLGPVTLLRLYGRDCDKMHIARGGLETSQQTPNLEVKVKLDGDRWDFLARCSGNHYIVAAGDIRRELKLLCRWLGISLYET